MVLIIFFGLLIVECVLLFILSGGKVFILAADFLNKAMEGSVTKNHYRGMAIVGGFICLPIIVLPLLVAFAYRNKYLKAEVAKIVGGKK